MPDSDDQDICSTHNIRRNAVGFTNNCRKCHEAALEAAERAKKPWLKPSQEHAQQNT